MRVCMGMFVCVCARVSMCVDAWMRLYLRRLSVRCGFGFWFGFGCGFGFGSGCVLGSGFGLGLTFV